MGVMRDGRTDGAQYVLTLMIFTGSVIPNQSTALKHLGGGGAETKPSLPKSFAK